jgi:hypothetical protein
MLTTINLEPSTLRSELFTSRRTVWVWCLVSFAAWILVAAWPVSSTVTRTVTLATFSSALVLLIAVSWRHVWCRVALLALIATCSGFLFMPAGRRPSPEVRRQDFIAALRCYEGVHYVWGGENFLGIDCSGLVRRGLIDASVVRGLGTFNPGLVREAAGLWWHDFSALDLTESRNGLTVPVVAAESLNKLNQAAVTPGDLAVTADGEHVMAYVGNSLWIEADPAVGRVILVKAPCRTNPWFDQRIKIVRLTTLGW